MKKREVVRTKRELLLTEIEEKEKLRQWIRAYPGKVYSIHIARSINRAISRARCNLRDADSINDPNYLGLDESIEELSKLHIEVLFQEQFNKRQKRKGLIAFISKLLR